MKASSRISQAPLNLKLASSILDLLLLVISTIIIYYIILQLVFGLAFGYNSKRNEIYQIEESYNLNLGQGLDYKKYEPVVKDFYVKFADKIVAKRKELYGDDFTIIHIYNTAVLRLPEKPTLTNYKTELYEYIQNSDGTINVDAYAKKIQGSGYNYDRYMSDLFYSTYSNLHNILEDFDSHYSDLLIETNKYQFISKFLAYTISLTILFIIIPLTRKNRNTIFERIFKVANVNLKDGYLAKNWRIVLKPIITYLIPLTGVLVGGRNGIVILFMLPLFVNYLITIFGKGNLEISEHIVRLEAASITESLLFKNKEDESEFLNRADNNITDEKYLSTLRSIKELNVINKNEEKKKSEN